MKGTLSTPWNSLVSLASSYSSKICRFAVEDFLARGIGKGNLTFAHPDGEATVFGEAETDCINNGHPSATITIVDPPSFYSRVATSADIGFAEAYMAGDFIVDDQMLLRVFEVLIINRDRNGLSNTMLMLSRLGTAANALLHRLKRNTILGSRRNIEAHYDLSNELFDTFLGKSWTYSCAFYGPLEVGEEKTDNLDIAQHRKLDMVIKKARLDSSCHVLEIGCGWGELAIRAAKNSGCKVTGITLSREQLVLGQKRVEAAGLSHLVDLQLVDYRLVGENGVKYDRIISIEMAEALGHEFLPQYFSTIDSLLKEDGLAVIQVITTPEPRYETYRTTTDFIQKHIFPGGICPSFEALVCAMSSASDLCVEHVQNIGVHYATTLREWRKRFLESAKEGRVAAAGFDEVFVRKWVYYLCYCEIGFTTRTLNNLQIVFSRSNNTRVLGGPPNLS